MPFGPLPRVAFGPLPRVGMSVAPSKPGECLGPTIYPRAPHSWLPGPKMAVCLRCAWRIIPLSKYLGSPPFISHEKAIWDLLTMVVNHLLTGMILQVTWQVSLGTPCCAGDLLKKNHPFSKSGGLTQGGPQKSGWWLGCPITSEKQRICRFKYHSQKVSKDLYK